MRFTNPIAAAILLSTMAYAAPSSDQAPDQVAAVAPIDARAESVEPLEKRACVYNGCRCNSRGRQFRSCGNCVWTNNGEWAISVKRDLTHVYECAPDGNCCDYGYARDCGGASARCYLHSQQHHGIIPMETFLLYLWTLVSLLFGLPSPHHQPQPSPPPILAHVPPPPAPEPITVVELPLPPVAPSDEEGSCSSEVNPARTGCIGRMTPIQSGNFLPDNLHVVSMVHFVGAPAAPDPASIYQGEQLIIVKIDDGSFANGEPWKYITCGVPERNTKGSTSKLDYPQAFNDGRRILAGTNIIQASTELASDDLTPDQAPEVPCASYASTPITSTSAGAPPLLTLAPSGQYCYFGRLVLNPNPSTGLPLTLCYDLTSVNVLYDPSGPQPLAVHPTNPTRLLLNASGPSVGELRGFSASGREVTYIGSPAESSNVDVFAADLSTGAVRRLTSHPEYVDPVDLSPEGEDWAVVMNTRSTGRQMFLSGLRRVPPLTDLVTVAAVASVRNNGYRRFFQPWLIDRYGDRGEYIGQRINADGDGVPRGGDINDPEWNGVADPKWSGDGTRIAYWQAFTRAPDCGGVNPLPGYESTAQGGRTSRLMVAHLTSRKPADRAPVEVAADSVPWGVKYVPGGAAPKRPVPAAGQYVLFGKASGWVNMALVGDEGGSWVTGVEVEYHDNSDDGENVLRGTEKVAARYPSLSMVEWKSTGSRTWSRPRPEAGTKKTNTGGFHMSIDVMVNEFEANGTLTTVVGG
ncbi:hypothetical protein ACHAQH_004910 [Verticillium albo-atrum]